MRILITHTHTHSFTTMLSPEQELIAEVIGYRPLNNEEKESQYEIEVNFVADNNSVPFNGAIALIDGVKSLYWMPQSKQFRDEFDDLVGWYEVPSNDEIETWVFDSVVPTPCDEDVEPDHPDSWLSLLGLC